MIVLLLPLTKKKIEILKYLYEKEQSHLREISKNLKIHPFQTKKIIDSLVNNKILEQKKAGKTILLKINTLFDGFNQLIYIIEDYKQKVENKRLREVIKILKQKFSKNKEILACSIFGSYAREAQTKASDIDILFVIRNEVLHYEIMKAVSQFRSLFQVDINPIIFSEREFLAAVNIKDPGILTILKPSQRILVLGLEYFIKETVSH